jgi:hypothetical protein
MRVRRMVLEFGGFAGLGIFEVEGRWVAGVGVSDRFLGWEVEGGLKFCWCCCGMLDPDCGGGRYCLEDCVFGGLKLFCWCG